MDGENVLKLERDEQGLHHYIPVSWVTAVNDQVHLSRPGDDIKRD